MQDIAKTNLLLFQILVELQKLVKEFDKNLQGGTYLPIQSAPSYVTT